MRLAILPVLALALTLVAGTNGALAQSIEITFDLAGTQHEGEILPGSVATLYILARPGVLGGFTGAEFWVNGVPANWPRTVIPNPANSITLGNPLATSPPFRADIGFPICMRPDANGVVLLYSVFLVPVGLVTDGCLLAQVAIPPTNSMCTTPILWRNCYPPEDTFAAATGVPFIMNPVTHQCTVGVEAATWGGIKHLYTE